MQDLALRITGLTKAFRGKRVVDGVDMTVARGEIVGFLGPNGAGKTTVMNMVTGLVAPDGGEIALLGATTAAALRDTRLRIGYLQEKPRIYPEMTARAYLTLFARLYGVANPARRVDEVLERVDLTRAADRPMGAYSRGMQQRACLARVMLHAPEFLILDEPTLGLDPSGVADMRDIFREMRGQGVTLLFSSHQLAEMERVCDSVVFLSKGRVIAQGHPAELLPAFADQDALAVELHEPVHPALDRMRALPGIRAVRETATHRTEVVLEAATGRDARDRRADLARALTQAGLTVLSVGAATPTLEDLFLTLAGERPLSPNPHGGHHGPGL